MSGETNNQTTSTSNNSLQTQATNSPATEAPAGGESANSSAEPDAFDFAGLATHDEYADPVDETTPAAAQPSSAAAVSPAPISPEPAATVAASVVTQQLAQPIAPAAQPAAPAQVQAPGTPVQATQPAATTAPEQTPQPGTSLEQIDFSKHRETYIPKLAKMYELTPEQTELMRTNPEQVLPQMAANLHYEVQAAALQTVLQALPSFIGVTLEHRETQNKLNDQFYGKWPALKAHVSANPQAEEGVRQAIKAFKNANPKATTEDVIARAGLLAMMTLGLPLETQAQPVAQGAAPTGAAPVAPVQAPTFHRPAGVAATGHAPNRPAPGVGDEGNIFEDLANAFASGDI